METIINIPVRKTIHSGLDKVNWASFQFGQHTSDHMFECVYKNNEWQEPHIKPFQNLSLSPLTLALHYGQSIFEGMKAFRMEDGSINIFRIDKHYERFNRSLERMCMPPVPYDLFITALHQLVALDHQWVPAKKDTALYIRPFVFASEAKMGVKVSEEYKFIVVTGPVPTLYQNPIKVKVERDFIRAAKGGTGFAKCAGNYGGSFYPTQKAREEGFEQVIWTDAVEHEFIEESGMMNVMFVINGKLVTPPLSDSILDGITRDSLLEIAAAEGIETDERKVSVNEIKRALKDGSLTEAFGAGTAAVVAPIGTIGIDGELYELPVYFKDNILFRLKEKLEAIRSGIQTDPFNWNSVVKP
jgi:branched-chain amino acid aminotransferase